MGLLCDSSGEQCVLVYHFISLFHLFLAAVLLFFARFRRAVLLKKGELARDEVSAILYLIAGFLVVMSISLWVLV